MTSNKQLKTKSPNYPSYPHGNNNPGIEINVQCISSIFQFSSIYLLPHRHSQHSSHLSLPLRIGSKNVLIMGNKKCCCPTVVFPPHYSHDYLQERHAISPDLPPFGMLGVFGGLHIYSKPHYSFPSYSLRVLAHILFGSNHSL